MHVDHVKVEGWSQLVEGRIMEPVGWGTVPDFPGIMR